jgi:hypothetical protein
MFFLTAKVNHRCTREDAQPGTSRPTFVLQNHRHELIIDRQSPLMMMATVKQRQPEKVKTEFFGPH